MVLDILKSEFPSSRVLLIERPQEKLPPLYHIETSPPTTEKNYLEQLVGKTDWRKKKGNSGKHRFHVTYKGTPIELLFSPVELYDYRTWYYQNNQGNVLAPAYYALGLVLSEHGLHWHAEKPIRRRLELSVSPRQILGFLFPSLDHRYVSTEQAFSGVKLVEEVLANRNLSILDYARHYFPEFRVRCEQLEADKETLKQWEKFNFSDRVEEVTGLVDKERTAYIRELHKKFPGGTWEFRRHALSLSELDLKVWIGSLVV